LVLYENKKKIKTIVLIFFSWVFVWRHQTWTRKRKRKSVPQRKSKSCCWNRRGHQK